MQDEFSFSQSAQAEDLLEEVIPLAMGIATHYANIPGATLDELRAEARIAAWDAVKSFDENRGVDLATYVGRVVRNRLKSLFRKESTRRDHVPHSLDFFFDEEELETVIDTIPGEGNSVLDAVCLKEAASVLREIIAELPERQREFAISLLRGETDAETARQMGITKQSLHAIRQKALKRLRVRLEQCQVRETTQLASKPKGDFRNRPQDIFSLPAEVVLDILLPDPVD